VVGRSVEARHPSRIKNVQSEQSVVFEHQDRRQKS
jgi:hypothetical protein